jgi:hypothetical protein
MRVTRLGLTVLIVLLFMKALANAAYHHGGDTDSDIYQKAYPEILGTKLDSCATCHSGGQYINHKGKLTTVGSCQWCHYVSEYDEQSDRFEETLNSYGRDYRENGRNLDALTAIIHVDSDGDGYTNAEEIAALRYPGDIGDDPSKVTAPYRVFSRKELEALPQHTQFMLMNTHKSGDFYVEYKGVPMADLLDAAGITLPLAESIHILAPDGWSQFHPLENDQDPSCYHVYGPYRKARYYYHRQADKNINKEGWCDYSAPSNKEHTPGEFIENSGGLKMILAIKRNGENLVPGALNSDNKLDGEGPFRVVPPQKNPGPPDQSTKADDPSNPDRWKWPFDENADHNAGFATRSATMIRVEPLPAGTTDVNTLEAGWNYVDEGKIIVYGAIDPRPTLLAKIDQLLDAVDGLDYMAFKRPILKYRLLWKIYWLRLMVEWEKDHQALKLVEKRLLPKVDGCEKNGGPEGHDWIRDCEAQAQIYWALHELKILLKLLE